MKSEVNYRPSTNQSVVDTYTKMINEWEVATGRYADFHIVVRGDRVSLNGRAPVGSTWWYPYLTLHECQFSEDVYHITDYILGNCDLKVGFNLTLKRLQVGGRGHSITTLCTVRELNDILGVDDILDVQPHEYGLLRLKYNYKGGVLFIPEEVKSLIREKGIV